MTRSSIIVPIKRSKRVIYRNFTFLPNRGKLGYIFINVQELMKIKRYCQGQRNITIDEITQSQ